MTYLDTYIRISAAVFNRYVETHLDSFKQLHSDLRQAGMGMMLREYLSVCFFTALLTALLSFSASLSVLMLLGKTLAVALVLSVIITAAASLGIFILAMEYPATKAAERKRDIDNNLPFATLYMNTIAGTGSPPYTIFRLLADFKEYGEVSKESQKIVEAVEVMGQDIEVSLQRTAETTPSNNFRDLLWSMITTIVRGGDLKILLQQKSALLMEDYRRRMEEYTNDLSMYVEVYITLVIVGSIFSIVMFTIMGSISGFASLRAIQEVMVYVFLPLASTVFIVLLKLTSPVS